MPFLERIGASARAGAFAATFMLLGSCGSPPESASDVLNGGFAELRATAQDVITDPVRQAKYLQHCADLEAALRGFELYTAGFLDRLQRQFTDYDVERAELQALVAEFRERRGQAQRSFIDAHRGMASSVTLDEWGQLWKRQKKLVDALRDASARNL